MSTYPPITLEIIFQQCYDLQNLDPAKNVDGCLECFQGIYFAQQYKPKLDELAAMIQKFWGQKLSNEAFRRALNNFRNSSHSQAFDNAAIDAVVAKYYQVIVNLSEKPMMTNRCARNYTIKDIGTLGFSGTLRKLVAGTDLRESGWHGLAGCKWAVSIVRLDKDNKWITVRQFDFPVENPTKEKVLFLRGIEITDGLPIKVLATDRISLGVFGIYQAYFAEITNTEFDFYIELDPT